ncbi:MAG: cysteine methyltransferase, partial [Saprospiraceae bacterium]|nr:cysteine methyltransferase [Saprospiraceae bacterium]
RKGELSGRHHFSGSGIMQSLLEAEGVEVKDHRVVDFETLFWHPASADEIL